MPRARPPDGGEAAPAHAGASHEEAAHADEGRRALVRFLRALADRVERDPALAEALLAPLRESGLLAAEAGADAPPRAAPARRPPASPSDGQGSPPPPDPFAVLREGGEAGLRARLGDLDLPALRQIVRRYRLDPARLSARWAARERVIELIVEQVRARSNLGRAFERV